VLSSCRYWRFRCWLAKKNAVSAHADLCDLKLRGGWMGHLASFGLQYGEGPGAKLDPA
jgi:hypothetical protein